MSLLILLLLTGCDDHPAARDDGESPIARIEIKSAKSEFWLADTLTIAADLFAAATTQSDDITVLSVQYNSEK